MKCDRALLSSYLDNELTAVDRHRLEAHLAECEDCADRLERYRRLRFDIRDAPRRRAPAQLRANMESRIMERGQKQHLRWLPLAVGAPLSLIGVLAGAAYLAPREDAAPRLAVTATSPATGATRVAPDGAVELWFDRELAPGTGDLTVTVDPPLPVRVAVEGNAVRIEPQGAFQPGQRYTVAVDSALDVDGRRLTTPAVVSFVTAPATLAEPPTELGSPRGESVRGELEPAAASGLSAPITGMAGVASSVGGTNIETVGLAAQTRKWPVSRASSSQVVAEPSPASVSAGEALGSLQSPYQTMRVLEQAFQGGVMLRIADTSQTLVLQRGRNTWQAVADPAAPAADAQTDASLPPPPGALAPSGLFAAVWQGSPSIRAALGWAVYEPRVSAALVQQREHGTAVTLGRMAYLLRGNGTWNVVPVAKS